MNRSNMPGWLSGAIAVVPLVFATACATKDDVRPPKASDFAANNGFEIKSGRGVLADPVVMVIFEQDGAELCPIDTQFFVNGVPLATGVPTFTKSKNDGPPRNSMTWKAVDKNMVPVSVGAGWHYSLVFHPFARGGAGAFISEPVDETQGDGSTVTFQQVGPFNFRWQEQIPVGVDYKYSIVRVVDLDPDPDKEEWEIVEACAPLDPNIRVW